jgi:hypothetical protein
MTISTIDYSGMIDKAMRSVVRESLELAQKHGLPGQHHFYISFLTKHPGVKISESLHARYPEEMTIVMQHQYWDLKVEDTQFSLMLSFSNIPEKLVVPYSALTAFADPSIKFGLQFHAEVAEIDTQNNMPLGQKNRIETKSPVPPAAQEDDKLPPADGGDDKVITLEKWRKK